MWTPDFDIFTNFWIWTVIVVEEVPMCKMAITDFRKSIIDITLKICTFDPLLNTIIYSK